MISFSPQQTAFIDWAVNGSGSCVLEAVAGAGKTTTLLAAAERMPGQVAILAYNKKIADEIKGKLEARGIGFRKAQAGTVHSFGFSAYRKQFPGVRVDDRKVDAIADEVLSERLLPYKPMLLKLVSLAKQRALGILERAALDDPWFDIIDHFDLFDMLYDVDGPDEQRPSATELVSAARSLLKASNQQTTVIDFDDMIYLPLIYKVRFWRFDVVMVDEAQDTNPARRALVRALVKRGGRVIAVGDRHQAIYGFTGADSDSLDLIAKDFDCIRLPLTVTYRCPKTVVAFAQQWVSHIEAADSAPTGTVEQMDLDGFFAAGVGAGDAVLCRLTRPLVSLAFDLIRRRIPCRVEGRDVSARLKKLAQRWKVTELADLEDRLDRYLTRETTKLLAKGKEAQLQHLEDAVETLKVIIDQCRSEGKHGIDDLIAYLDDLFSDNVEDMLVLSTIHKSKGREWERVFWLDRAGTCPSRWARQEWQKEQEVNLQYVAATRAQSILVDLTPQSAIEEKKEAA